MRLTPIRKCLILAMTTLLFFGVFSIKNDIQADETTNDSTIILDEPSMNSEIPDSIEDEVPENNNRESLPEELDNNIDKEEIDINIDKSNIKNDSDDYQNKDDLNNEIEKLSDNLLPLANSNPLRESNNFSIDLKWANVDSSQSINQKIVTTQTSVIKPKYVITASSKVDLDINGMEIRLPYSMFEKRTTDVDGNNNPITYSEAYFIPTDIGTPKVDQQISDDTPFQYYVDTDKNELVFINKKPISIGDRFTIEVAYSIFPGSVKDLDPATFQATLTAKLPNDSTEELKSDEITYQIDTGIEEFRNNNDEFTPYMIKDDYRYYKVDLKSYTLGNQPFDLEYTYDFDGSGGEFADIDSFTKLSETEIAKLLSDNSYVVRSADSNEISHKHVTKTFYVRYPHSAEIKDDKLKINIKATGSDDNYADTEDKNDIQQFNKDFSYAWPKFPGKPDGIFKKGPDIADVGSSEWLIHEYVNGQVTSRVNFYSENGDYVPDFYLGCVNGLSFNNDKGGSIIFEDNGLVPHYVFDRFNEQTVEMSPEFEYEILNITLPMLKDGTIYQYDSSIDYANPIKVEDWCQNLKIECSRDGETWEVVFDSDDPKSYHIINNDHFDDSPNNKSKKLYVNQGYKQFRIIFSGVEDELFTNTNRLVNVYYRSVDYSADYILRDYTDSYKNIATINVKNKDNTDVIEVTDVAYLGLTPFIMNESGYLYKSQIKDAINDPSNSRAIVDCYVATETAKSFTDSHIYYPIIRESAPKFFDNIETLYNVDEIVSYDLLPQNFKFLNIGATNNDKVIINFTKNSKYDDVNYAIDADVEYEVFDNFRGSNRQLVKFTFNLKDAKNKFIEKYPNIFIDKIFARVNYQMEIDYKDIPFSQFQDNLVASQRGDGGKLFGAGNKDNAESIENNSIRIKYALDSNGQYVFLDINEDGKETSTMYENASIFVDVAASATTGIDKKVRGNNSSFVDSDETSSNQEYQYEIRISNDDSTYLRDLIVYDVLEGNESGWKGKFKSVNVDGIIIQSENSYYDWAHGEENYGFYFNFKPIVYYSTKDLSNTDYQPLISDGNNIWINDKTTWSTTIPEDPSTVTAIAVDLRRSNRGGNAILYPKQGISFIVNMEAPDSNPAKEDPNKQYALNKPVYHALQYIDNPSNGVYMNQPGNETKLFFNEQDIKGTKTWYEREEVNGKYEIVDNDGNGYPSSRLDYAIIASNYEDIYGVSINPAGSEEWVIYNLPIVDEDGNKIEYTLEEYASLSYDEHFTISSDDQGLTFKTVKTDRFKDCGQLELILLENYFENDGSKYRIKERKNIDSNAFDTETVLWENINENSEYFVLVDFNNIGYQTSINGTDVYNTRLMDVTATKRWNNPDNLDTPEIKIELYKVIDGVTSLVEDSTRTIPANAEGDSLTVVWEDLPEYENGKKVVYYPEETVMDSFKFITSIGDDVNGFTIINKIEKKKETKEKDKKEVRYYIPKTGIE